MRSQKIGRLMAGVAAFGAVAAAAPGAHAAGYAYVTNLDSNSLTQYAFNPSGAPLANGSTTTVVPAPVRPLPPSDVIVGADGKSVYAAVSSTRINAYDVSPTGTLAPKASGTGVTMTNAPQTLALSPDGKSLYVAASGGVIDQFDVAADGSLARKPAGAITTSSVFRLVISPNGKFLYALDFSSGTIRLFDIVAGSLSARGGASALVTCGTNARDLRFAPDGKSLYGVFGTGACQFDVGGDGLLTPKAGGTKPIGLTPFTLETSPDGRALYVYTSNPENSTGFVVKFTIGPDGSLVEANAPFIAVPRGVGLIMNPDGRSLYALDSVNRLLRRLAIGPTGLLTDTGAAAPTGVTPQRGAMTPNQGPIAAFASAPAPAGVATGFDASASSDPDGTVARYDWDFGDGSTGADGGAAPSHVYAAPGTYTVTLTVTDDAGCSHAVFNGRLALCNAAGAAVSTGVVTIGSAPAPGAGGGGDGGGGGAVPAGGGDDDPPVPPDTTLPVFASASLTEKKFAVDRKGDAEVELAGAAPKGTTIRYSLSEDAVVVVTIERESTGRTVGGKCVKQTSKNRKRKRCALYTETGAFEIDSEAGANRHEFSGRIGRSSLAVGSYRASLDASDAAGNDSKTKRLAFKVVRR